MRRPRLDFIWIGSWSAACPMRNNVESSRLAKRFYLTAAEQRTLAEIATGAGDIGFGAHEPQA
jgi:hypothetical protein